jgi:hypothetical protein
VCKMPYLMSWADAMSRYVQALTAPSSGWPGGWPAAADRLMASPLRPLSPLMEMLLAAAPGRAELEVGAWCTAYTRAPPASTSGRSQPGEWLLAHPTTRHATGAQGLLSGVQSVAMTLLPFVKPWIAIARGESEVCAKVVELGKPRMSIFDTHVEVAPAMCILGAIH